MHSQASIRSVALSLMTVLLTACSVITLDLTPRIRPLVEETVEGRGDAKILLMDISGFLSDEGTSTTLTIGAAPPRVPLLVRIREELKKAEEDKQVRAIVLKINSPGGTVTASDIVFRELQDWKRRTGVPVIAVMLDVAASGGYYIALAADRIIAHPTTVTGSIGVIMISLNAQGLMEKVGLSTATIKSGARKDMGSPFRTLEPEERAILQAVIDDLHTQFVTKLVERRGIALDTAKTIADGRIYTAEQALRLRLVDRIGYMADAVTAARNAAGVSEAKVIVYHRPREYRATYYAGPARSTSGIDAPLAELASILGPGAKFLYLWWP
jgi:protease-4